MLNFFSKNRLTTLLALVALNTMGASLAAQEFYYDYSGNDYCCPSTCNRLYIGAFGGELFSDRTRVRQRGTAFFSEDDGGPLAVDAHGRTKSSSSGFGGVQIGYEWTHAYDLGCSGWSLAPAAELEAFWYSHKKRGDLINDAAIDRLDEHDFRDTFPMDVGVYLINGVVSINSCCLGNFTPYVGGGIGAARLSIHGADSLQISPPEPDINHFNSDRHDASWTFAAQAKVGLRYNFCERFHIFGEYRYLYVDSSRFLLGSTVDPDHAPTSTWDIDVNGIGYNAFAFGIQFDL